MLPSFGEFFPAIVCHFCRNLPEKFSQPRDHFLAPSLQLATQPASFLPSVFRNPLLAFGAEWEKEDVLDGRGGFGPQRVLLYLAATLTNVSMSELRRGGLRWGKNIDRDQIRVWPNVSRELIWVLVINVGTESCRKQSDICQKSVRKLSVAKICQKSVRNVSEFCQKTVRCKYLSELYQKRFGNASEMCQIL